MERTVWLISSVIALVSIALSLFVHPAFVLLVTVTGLTSFAVAVSGN